MQQLGVSDQDLVDRAYVDLLKAQKNEGQVGL
jgi:hypothetical protein